MAVRIANRGFARWRSDAHARIEVIEIKFVDIAVCIQCRPFPFFHAFLYPCARMMPAVKTPPAYVNHHMLLPTCCIFGNSQRARLSFILDLVLTKVSWNKSPAETGPASDS